MFVTLERVCTYASRHRPRLHGLDVGNGLADVCLGDFVLFFGVTVDRLIVIARQ